MKCLSTIIVGISVLAWSGISVGQSFDIPWYTIDGGGAMGNTGGDFELSGTIAQPDAGRLIGGPFVLQGGFWPCPSQPSICVSTDTLTVSCTEGENAPSESFEVWNCGDGILSYAITTSGGWMTCDPQTGTSTGEHDTIDVFFQTAALLWGSYEALITITDPQADNDPQTIAVSLTVERAPVPPVPEYGGPTCEAGVKFCHGGTQDGVPCSVNEDCPPNPGGMCLDDCWDDWSGASCVVYDNATGAARCYAPKNRYLTIDPTVNEEPVAYHIALDTDRIEFLDDQYVSCGVIEGFLSEPECVDSAFGVPVVPQPDPSDPCQGEGLFGWVTYFDQAPSGVVREWQEYPLFVTGCEIVPAATYLITASFGGQPVTAAYSLEIMTAHEPSDIPQGQYWGDVSGGPVPGNPPPGTHYPTDYTMSFADVAMIIATFGGTGPPLEWCDVEIDHVVTFGDIAAAIAAFGGTTYPGMANICTAPGGRPLIGHEPCECADGCPLQSRGLGSATGGDVSTVQADCASELSDRMNTAPAATGIYMVSSAVSVRAGESVVVRVYLRDPGAVGVYEVALDTSGGAAGRLVLEDLFVSSESDDFVFTDVEFLHAVDTTSGRLGAAVFGDGVVVVEPGYLGTFVFQATEDARGTFYVDLRKGIGTFIRDASGMPIPFERGVGPAIEVLSTEALKPTRMQGR